MPRPSIDYLRERAALKPASGGTNYRRRERVQYAAEPDTADMARDIIGAFSLWAETSRQWRDGLKPNKPQQPCDIGLFSDDHLQLDLVEMLMEPTNEE